MGRRIDVWAASLVALLGLAAPGPASAGSTGMFEAPTGPLELVRTLRRPLPDGVEIVSTRRYEVRIVPDGDGFRVVGRLLDARVEVPPSLGALAAMERNRPDTGLFPFRLDREGLIATPAAPTDRTARSSAAARAKLTIASSTLADPDREQAQELIDQLVAKPGGNGAHWPEDLFRPAPGLRSQTSRFALPDGRDGSVTTTIDSRREGAGNAIERTVITETGGTQRITRETYIVEPRRQG
jgi:hypothetical protein